LTSRLLWLMIGGVAAASAGTSTGAGGPHRRIFLGLERQGLGWTLAIGAIALLLAVGLPVLDSAITTEDAPAAGSVTSVGLGVRITPVSSWSVVAQSGGDPADQAQFTRSGALLTIRAASYSGTAQAAYERLAAAIDAEDGVQIASDPETVTTNSGLTGIVSGFASSTEQGYFAVFARNGVLAVVIGESPLAAFGVVDADMRAMIGSVELGAGGG
jgi:hypothetical protein